MTSSLSRLLLMLILTGWLLPGCMRIGQRPPAKTSYVITANRPASAAERVGAAVLQVTPMRISPRFNGRSFVYRQGISQFRPDFYNKFLVAPANLVQEQVVRWLTASGLFATVSSSAGPLPPDYLLQGQITELYGDYRDRQPVAILEIGFLFLQHAAADAPIRLNRSYRGEVPLTGHEPDALVEAWDTALINILENLEKDLGEVMDGIDATYHQAL
ncbi:protein of unknown function DUF330 [Syntrophotalea carbinolica DSM 2380]|uniref:ABC-type transport auxiliary lipoprotein component domain-containing protein n=1 Tax=Syntrophotalea carbinolica (strain DSM 2380 / NBRC 103641 / GraBd1) TaxID=338963 RepID=Q3A0X0_SYNC1|nr:ABC-type transport auxiliary lipoprotein family protein [Syntrophotalea carbinolica]ABA89987.1 protein of unknown function DUF330 [Syntrophotalea carbinolica DSM 2380]